MIDISSPNIAQLVIDARAELKRLGIDTEGKRSDELLNMVREQRNNPSTPIAGSRRPQRRTTPSLGCNTRESFTMRQLHGHNFIIGNVVRLGKRFPARKAASGSYKVV